MPVLKVTKEISDQIISRVRAGERLSILADEFGISFRHAQRMMKEYQARMKELKTEEEEDGYPFWAARGISLPALGDVEAFKEWALNVLDNLLVLDMGGVDTQKYVAKRIEDLNSLDLTKAPLTTDFRLDAARVALAGQDFVLNEDPNEPHYGGRFYQGFGRLGNKQDYRIVEAIQNLIELEYLGYKNGMITKIKTQN